MRNHALLAILLMGSCSDKKTTDTQVETYVAPHYDTTAIDSFSNGAISAEVATQIRMSSKEYQDSLKQAAFLLEEERKKNETEKKEAEKPQTEKEKSATTSNLNQTAKKN